MGKNVDKTVAGTWAGRIGLAVLGGVGLVSYGTALACEEPVGSVLAARDVQLIRGGESHVLPVGGTLCVEDSVRVGPSGRLSVELVRKGESDQLVAKPVVNLGPSSLLRFDPPKSQYWLLDLVEGWLRFFSPRSTDIDVATDYVVAGVRGTEFVLHHEKNGCEYDKAESSCSALWVQEGRVKASNNLGALDVDGDAEGDLRSVIAFAGQPPQRRVLKITPDDAANWAIYYPPLLNGGVAGPAALGSAISLINKGKVQQATRLLDQEVAERPDAALLALRSVLALKHNAKQDALAYAQRAVALDAASADAWLALSYAQQAGFDLDAASSSTARAAELQPTSPLILSRQAELALASGNTGNATQLANQAVELAAERMADERQRDPIQARAWRVLGFTQLVRLRAEEAKQSFGRALEADAFAPLAYLGMGLANIRQGELAEGVRDLELAVALDPRDSLLRSYLGKGYLEQGEPDLARKELELAKAFDAQDPTPWFYGGLLMREQQSAAQAMLSLQQSIELNDKRAPYRSPIGLKEDLIARETGLAVLYRDLGFKQASQAEATSALRADPSSHLAHRALADAYWDEPRLEVARASELLQAQLLQPLNSNPVQPRLAYTSLGLRLPTGPTPGFNEYSNLFLQQGAQGAVTGFIGSDNTLGEEVVASGMSDRVAFSVGQFHYETDGFRPDSELRHDIYNLFGQFAVTDALHIQAEYRERDTYQGDRKLDLNPRTVDEVEYQDINDSSARIGARWSPSSNVDWVFSYIESRIEIATDVRKQRFPFNAHQDYKTRQAEAQFLYTGKDVNLVAGAGRFASDGDRVFKFAHLPRSFASSQSIDATSLYAEASYAGVPNLDLTLGLGYEDYQNINAGNDLSFKKWKPSLGAVWQPVDGVSLRAAGYRFVRRTLAVDQTLEPTSIAGFNKLTDEFSGTVITKYGLGADFQLDQMLMGFEASTSESVQPYPNDQTEYKEHAFKAYGNWLMDNSTSLVLELKASEFEQDDQLFQPLSVETVKVPLQLRKAWGHGVHTTLGATYFTQRSRFSPLGGGFTTFKDSAVLFDAAISRSFAQGSLQLGLEVKNIFDTDFLYQDDSFRSVEQQMSPEFLPARTVLATLVATF